MKIAYLITAYKDEIQLARLIYALASDNTYFFVHIDKKVNLLTFKKQINKLDVKDKVYWVQDDERIRVNWGGYSQVKAQLALIRLMIDTGYYDWCVNLTGTDYPIASNEEIENFLSQQNAPVIKGYVLKDLCGTEKEKKVIDRVERYWLYDIEPVWLRRLVSITALIMQNIFHIKRKCYLKNEKWIFCSGSEYWALPFEILCNVYKLYLQDVDLQKVLKTVFVPSEFWVQTILMSTDILSNKQKKTIQFGGNYYDGLGSVALLHYFVYIGGIKILGIEDYDAIMNSEKLFIRKVETGISDELIEKIQETRSLIK